MATPLSDSQAATIVKDEWAKVWGRAPSSLETLYIMAIAKLETGYGRVGQFAAMADQGIYNWANLEKPRNSDGTCPAGWVPGVDSGKQVCFRAFSSDNQAANALIYNVTKRHWPVVQAIASDGSPESVAHAMKVAPAYYSAPEAAYAKALRNNIIAIGKSLQGDYLAAEQNAVNKPIPKDGFTKPLLLTTVLVGALWGISNPETVSKGLKTLKGKK